jgi:hypothetical protein
MQLVTDQDLFNAGIRKVRSHISIATTPHAKLTLSPPSVRPSITERPQTAYAVHPAGHSTRLLDGLPGQPTRAAAAC